MKDILFVTDFVCPYCIVAEEALHQAIRELGIEAQMRFWPMELTEEPNERIDTYSDPVRRERYKVLDEPVRKLGLDVKFPPKVIPRPYTRLAWEGWHYAQENGLGDAYASRMYRAYFIDELDIGDMELLVKLAKEVGLDADEYRKVLEEGFYREKEKDATHYSRKELRIQSIPSVFIDGELVKIKEYTKEEMVRLLMKEPSFEGVLMIDAGEEGVEDAEPFFACGPDGCGPRSDKTGGCGPDGCSF